MIPSVPADRDWTIRRSWAPEWDRVARPATTQTSVTTPRHDRRQHPCLLLQGAMPQRLLLPLVAVVQDDQVVATAAQLRAADAAGSDRLPSPGRYTRLQIR